ncbi:hypothetical protein J4050_08960 [Winogradskyella sp. DF17]|uniref:Glycine zipper-like domain-containing protein n=1 Tax=Winogradskyella pelagia TaxID=2819984 RepID=A0ABS3T560_9FLAO|nr:hypothetical protein [Winogradskyella sp. DF17]MBO3116875.1 hypothetical protein [Winogradskyella sp. DF17]
MEKRTPISNWGKGIAIGFDLGTAIGVATDKLVLWMPMGVAFGICFAMVFNSLADKSK